MNISSQSVAGLLHMVAHKSRIEDVIDDVAGAGAMQSLGATGLALYLTADDEGGLQLVRRQDPKGALADLPEHQTLEDAVPVDGGMDSARRPEDAAWGPGAGALLTRHSDGGRVRWIPLIVGAHLEGLLVVAGPDVWPQDEIEMLDLAGCVVALAIAGASARRDVAQLRANMRAARDGVAAVAGVLVSPSPDHHRPRGAAKAISQVALRSLVEHAVAATGAAYGALGIGVDPALPFDPWVSVGMDDDVAARIGRHPRPVGTLGVVAVDGTGVRVRDVRSHPAFLGFPPHHPLLSSLLGVPVRSGGRSLGNLYLGDKRSSPGFTADDQALVEVLAEQAAMALHYAVLLSTIDGQRAELSAIVDNAPHGILFVEAGTDRLTANRRAVEIFGTPLTPEGGRAQYASQLRRSEDLPLSIEELLSSKALRGETTRTMEHVIVRPDGTRVPILAAAAPARDEKGDVVGAIVTLEDITALKELEQVREEFAAVVAHDLRGPIQAILLQAEALEKKAVGDVANVPRRALEGMARSAARLGQMTSDLLDATRVDLRRVTLEKRPIDAADAVTALIDRLAPALGRHPVTVETSQPRPIAFVDALRFEQVLQNLVENAAKYSSQSAPIVVRLAADRGGLRVSVIDQGIGIAAEEQPRLFERLYQSRRARGLQRGLGLGLYIAKGLVEAHGGRISVTSELGKGSSFSAWFPGPDADAAQLAAAP